VPLFCGAFAARGARPYMEDRHVIVAPFPTDDALAGDAQAGTFVGVYDGHNGAFAAEHAASNLHVLLAADPLLRCVPGAAEEHAMPQAAGDAASARAAPAAGSDGAVADALVRAFLAVDSQILVASAAGGTREGATALVALRIGDALYTAHAGDSRGVAAVGGRAVRLTRDHTPACAHEAARVRSRGGQLEFAGCWRVVAPPPRGPPRPRAALAVTRALGDLSFKHPTPCVAPAASLAFYSR
jgi:serine/threonine protein phosphatase PrpC